MINFLTSLLKLILRLPSLWAWLQYTKKKEQTKQELQEKEDAIKVDPLDRIDELTDFTRVLPDKPPSKRKRKRDNPTPRVPKVRKSRIR
jgi:CRISPR/Cas system endoribonuclease Cas6 (RAMP superfamily)